MFPILIAINCNPLGNRAKQVTLFIVSASKWIEPIDYNKQHEAKALMLLYPVPNWEESYFVGWVYAKQL